MPEFSNKNMLLLSGSSAQGNLAPGQTSGYLDFAEPWIKEFFKATVTEQKPLLFVPYARPSGESEESYFTRIKARLGQMGIPVVRAPTEGTTEELLNQVGGIYVGGGHTPTLLYKLQQTGSLEVIRKKVEEGLPYMGSSAGTLIACPTIKTNNDMPGPANDVMDLRSLNLISAQLNCHYMSDAMHSPMQAGEKRDTRIREFCAFNPNVPVLGMYNGQALLVQGNKTHLLTSERTCGTKSPVFWNKERHEIECQIGVAQDVSRIFDMPDKSTVRAL